MVRMFVRHQVADYPAWRSVYDSIDETRASMGVTGHAVFRSTTDERDVTAYHDFESEDAAQPIPPTAHAVRCHLANEFATGSVMARPLATSPFSVMAHFE